MHTTTAHTAALASAIVITSISQVFLKSGATGKTSFIKSFLNWKTIVGYCLLAIVTILNVYAMQRIELKTITAWIGTTYILVVLFSLLFLKEKIDLFKIIGCGLIVFGVLIFTF
jgi:drug/metabolite transporter (DMT)-like permease